MNALAGMPSSHALNRKTGARAQRGHVRKSSAPPNLEQLKVLRQDSGLRLEDQADGSTKVTLAETSPMATLAERSPTTSATPPADWPGSPRPKHVRHTSEPLDVHVAAIRGNPSEFGLEVAGSNAAPSQPPWQSSAHCKAYVLDQVRSMMSYRLCRRSYMPI